MIKLAITSQLPRDNEHLFIERVIDAGWDWVHLRHPVASEEELRTIIERIDPLYYRRIKLHSFPQLVTEYKLGGVHLNSRVPSTDLDPQQYSISRSCHTISELHSPENKALDYVTLSPIFDSVSKQGYKGTFDADELSQIPHQPRVIALGGVTPQRLKQLKDFNFAGYAVLGYLAEARSLQQLSLRLSEFN